jgi:hypothetical protein
MPKAKIYGAAASFSSPEDLLDAAHAMREQGFTALDANTPFPVHGIDEALGIHHSPLGYVVLAGGVVGFTIASLLQWWTGAVNYPLIIGGKPFFAFEFSMPITFEVTVLIAAFCAVGGMLALNGLPRFYHPLFNYDGFRQVTNDKFVLTVEASDPRFRAEQIMSLLASLGADEAVLVEED